MGIRLARAISELVGFEGQGQNQRRGREGGPDRDRGLAMGGGGIIVIIWEGLLRLLLRCMLSVLKRLQFLTELATIQ